MSFYYRTGIYARDEYGHIQVGFYHSYRSIVSTHIAKIVSAKVSSIMKAIRHNWIATHERPILGSLLLLALLVRIYAAFYYSNQANTDVSTHAMMAQHIAEGRHFPLMFYNSSYVGTFEVYVGAAFHRFMPHSLLPSLLGFVLISFLGLPFFYLWAKRLFGMTSALCSLAFLVVGPFEFFYRNPFIGYPGVFLFGMAACWLTSVILDRHRKSISPGNLPLWLGLVSGIGWWISGLAVIYILPCAIFMALWISPREWGKLAMMGVLGALIGAAPWIYYASNKSEAVQFATDITALNLPFLLANLRVATSMLIRMLDFTLSLSSPLRVMRSISIIGLMLIPLFVGVISLSKKPLSNSGINWIHWMPFAIIFANLLVCGISNRFAHVPAARYLLPALPALMIYVGHSASMLIRHSHRHVRIYGLICMFLILFAEIASLPNYWRDSYRNAAQRIHLQVEQLAAFSQKETIEVMHGDFMLQWIPFLADERVRITSYPNYFDRYRPYRGQAILNRNVGVLNNYMGAGIFLSTTQGDARNSSAGGLGILWDLKRNHEQLIPLPGSSIHSARWEDGTDASYLFDLNLDTPLSLGHIDREVPGRTERTLHVSFDGHIYLAGLRAWGPSGTWAPVIHLEVNSAGDKETAYKLGTDYYGWFWSGGYPFLAGHMARFEASFSARRASEMRITLRALEDSGKSLVSEIQLLTIHKIQEIDSLSIDTDHDLIREIENIHPDIVYAPRWLAERIRKSESSLISLIPHYTYEQYDGLDRHTALPVIQVTKSTNAVAVIKNGDTPRSIELIQAFGGRIQQEVQAGAYSLLHFSIVKQENRPIDRLYWTENGPFAGQDPFAKDSAQALPHIIADQAIRFGRDKALHSLSIDRDHTTADGSIEINYQWHCGRNINPNRLAVFVHFLHDGQIIAQDDHVWMTPISSEALSKQPDNWIFSYNRKVTFPSRSPSGDYTIRLGLYDRRTGKRLKPAGDYVIRRNSVLLSDALYLSELPDP
jgi:hypothetical protein